MSFSQEEIIQIAEAKRKLCAMFNATLRDGMSATEFCAHHEKWAQSHKNKIEMACGLTIRMSDKLAYAYYIQQE